jgi:hypothetical protein
MTTALDAAAHPWPHLSTTHAELRFEHHSEDPRGGDLRGCLVVRPPAGKVVHLGLSRPMIAAEELLAAAGRALADLLEQEEGRLLSRTRAERIADLRAAIAKAAGS